MTAPTRSVFIAAAMIVPLAASASSAERLFDYGSECLHCKLLRTWSAEGSELRFNPGTGKDLRNYPPDREVDFEHMKLELDIPEMNEPRMDVTQTLTLSPIAEDLSVLELDAMQFHIRSAQFIGPARIRRDTSFSHDGEDLAIRFEPPIRRGERAMVQIQYTVEDPADGLFWTTESDAWPERPPQIHTQGQPETNQYWFPCHDFPNERLSTEIIATVPEDFVVSSNGRQVEQPVTTNGRTTFHWLQEQPHPNYLVSLIIGQFDVQDIAPADFDFPMPVYVPRGEADKIDRTYGNTPAMVRVFEERFDEPYPYNQYAQLVVWNFGAGGMENTSATTMFDTAVLDAKSMLDDDLDGLIAHELGHQWFGDLITCKSWEHIWLNEGWATYTEALWFEQRDGMERGYQWDMYKNLRRVADRDQLAAGSTGFVPAMVSPVYEHPWQVFRRQSNPYPKGASVLHMLRMKLGEDIFFRGVAEYVDRFRNDVVETDDFRKVMEDVSGRSLQRFFTQWCERPGSPWVEVTAKWDEKDQELSIKVEQLQRIDAEHPAFVFDLPIVIEPDKNDPAWAGESPRELNLEISTNTREQVVSLPGEPGAVIVDPLMTVLMKYDADLKTDWLIAQLGTDRSLTARLDAARLLSTHQNSRAIAALAEKVNEATSHYSVRAMAAESLGKLRAESELVSLAANGIDEAKVRVAVIEALGEVGGSNAENLLKVFADDESESYACRAAALHGLGKIAESDDGEAFDILVRALGHESQHDRVRSGALRGLAALDTPGGIDQAAEFTQHGYLSRLRPVAIEALADLAHHDPDFAFDTLVPLLYDNEDRTRRAAGMALVTIEDERGIEVLDNLIASAKNPDFRAMAEHWRDDLAAIVNSSPGADSSHELERLKREVERLKTQMEK